MDNVLTSSPQAPVSIFWSQTTVSQLTRHRPELAERLQEAGIKVVSIEWLRERARADR
ncbi:hypothetical protein ACLB1R_16195 [Escherichia coli]